MGKLITITDKNYGKYVDPDILDAKGKRRKFAKGLVPRDFKSFAQGYMSGVGAFDGKLIPEKDIPDLIRQQEADKSSLEHICEYYEVPCLDQNGQGYCWAYSTTYGVMCLRARAGLATAKLSAHMIGCLVKNYRDQGGWNLQSLKVARELGIPTIKTWKEKSMSRSNDTAEMRAEAKQNIVSEWYDLSDRADEVKIQLATLLLLNIPVSVDFNWWGHSVCAVRLISWSPFKIRIRNSWTPNWGRNGYGDLEGSRAIPNGATSPRLVGVI